MDLSVDKTKEKKVWYLNNSRALEDPIIRNGILKRNVIYVYGYYLIFLPCTGMLRFTFSDEVYSGLQILNL